jgi:hypothetical protein
MKERCESQPIVREAVAHCKWRSEAECRRREACAGVSPAAVPIAALST